MVDVFAMAFTENAKLSKDENSTVKKTVKEGLKKSKVNESNEVKQLKLSQIRFTEDVDEINQQPDEDVVVVYNDEIHPDMTEEEVEAAAQDMIGSKICKCGVCGANYICDHKCEDEVVVDDEPAEEPVEEPTEDEDDAFEIGESLLFREDDYGDEEGIPEDPDDEPADGECNTVCPVCNAEEDQIIVGEISELGDEATVDAQPELDEPEVPEDDEKDESVEDQLGIKESFGNINNPQDAFELGVDNVFDYGDESLKDDPEEYWHSGTGMYFDDWYKKLIDQFGSKACKESDYYWNKFLDEINNEAGPKVEEESINFNEVAMNRILRNFVKENYKNIKDARITEGVVEHGTFKLSGKVLTTDKKIKSFKMESKNFKLADGQCKFKFTESGVFTENAHIEAGKVPFVLLCSVRGKNIRPTGLKYQFNRKVENKWFACQGKSTISE